MEELAIIIFSILILVHLSAGESEITVLAGQNTTLPCISPGIPSHVTWLKGDKPPGEIFAIYADNMIQYRETIDKDRYRVQKDLSPGISSFSLTIAYVEIADAGRYRCAVTDNGPISSNLYHLKVLDALYTSVATLSTSGHESATASVNIRPLHESTPTTPASTLTVTTTRQNETTTDVTGSVNSRPDAWKIAVGVIFGVVIIVVALAIIAVYRKRIREAIKQRRCQRTPHDGTRSPSQPNRDDNEHEAVNETLMTTVC